MQSKTVHSHHQRTLTVTELMDLICMYDLTIPLHSAYGNFKMHCMSMAQIISMNLRSLLDVCVCIYIYHTGFLFSFYLSIVVTSIKYTNMRYHSSSTTLLSDALHTYTLGFIYMALHKWFINCLDYISLSTDHNLCQLG